jgi:hypothetical protein
MNAKQPFTDLYGQVRETLVISKECSCLMVYRLATLQTNITFIEREDEICHHDTSIILL